MGKNIEKKDILITLTRSSKHYTTESFVSTHQTRKPLFFTTKRFLFVAVKINRFNEPLEPFDGNDNPAILRIGKASSFE